MAKVQHTCTGCVPIDASIIDVYVTLVETNKSVTNAEAGRTEAEAARVVAETQRTSTFATDHSRAVADHSIAQSDHATAGSDHTSTVAATNAANAAAAVANAKAELVQARLDTADADHTRAEGDHSTAVSDHSTASSDHTAAQSDHATADTDHTRAESDHSTAASDHTASGTATAAATAAATLATEKAALVQDKLDRADTDHTRAESDHSTAVSDHGIAGTDHTTATGDHTTASADHTLAGADHTTAASDHTTAGSDHTLAAADHTTAAADHTQALADHDVVAGYDTRLTAVEGDVTELEAKVTELDEQLNGEAVLDNIVVESGGMMTFDAITLSQDGDSLEIEALFSGSLNYNSGYAFAGYGTAIAIDLEPTIFGVKNAGGTWLDGMNGGNNQYQTGVHLYEGKNIRLVYENSKIHLYVDGTMVHEVATQSAVTIDRVCYERQSGGQSYYWEGTIRKFNYTHGGVTKSIIQFDNFSTTGGVTINTSTGGGLQAEVENLKGEVETLMDGEKYVNLVKDLGWGVKFNGTDAYCSLNENIVLSQEGDSIEFDLIVNETVQTDGYAFCTGGRPNGLGMGVTRTTLDQISDDGTWLCERYDLGSAQHQTIKVLFDDGKMKYYRNGVLVATYNGQKQITFKKFGLGRDIYGYWDGTINSIKVNGSNYDLAENSVFTNAELYRENGFLEPWQVTSSLPEIVVSPTDSTHFQVKVLDRGSGKYIVHTFERSQGSRTINDVVYNSLDVWHSPEVLDENGRVLYQGNLNFIYYIGKVDGVASSDASVNENCHIGPGHGCEVMQFCKFFTDGKEFNPATATEDVNCSVFRMVMKSTCYVGDSSYNTGNVNNYPKIVDGAMVEHAVHYLDAYYRVNNDIKWTNRLTQVREASVQYEMLAGGMAQAFLAYVGNLMLNDIENSWNEIIPGVSTPVYSAPSGYDSVILHGTYRQADSVIEYGDGVILKQKIDNVDNSKRDHLFIHTWSNNNASFKCYLMPARVVAQTNPDTFTEGDVVEVNCERQIEIS